VSKREKMERLDHLSPHEGALSTSLQASKPNGKDAELAQTYFFRGLLELGIGLVRKQS